MNARAALRLAACMAALVVAANSAIEARRLIDMVVIRVYDLAQLDATARHEAIHTARSILADAGLDADWQDCRAAATAPCAGPRGRHDLLVRIVTETAPPTVTPAAATETLGYSVLDGSGGGTLATLFAGRIERLARGAAADYGVLMGRAMAHEVGHLLLRTRGHGQSGLMREIWTEGELFRNRRDDWLFGTAERRQLRSAWLRDGDSASN